MRVPLVKIYKDVGRALVVVLLVLVLGFALIHLSPGDPALAIVGPSGAANPELLAKVRETYGFNNSIFVQFGGYLSRILQGDFGESYYYHTDVLGLIVGHILNTLLLAFCALLIASVGGTMFGVISGWRPNGIIGNLISIVALGGYSIPVFFLGMILIILFASIIPIFPLSGMYPIVPPTGIFEKILAVGYHLVLPSLALGINYLVQYMRTGRASTIEIMSSDYIKTARSKGASEIRVLRKHVLKNALMPIVTLIGVQAGRMVSGAILVEVVFLWPGIGTLAVQSVGRRDMPVLLGIFIISSIVVVIATILTDIVYRLLDPRVRV